MAFTEFYVQTTGSNLNAGSTTADAAIYTATNGGWNSGTGVFTPTSGDPSATVSVGMFASVYLDAATVTGFVGRVTAVSSTTITISITVKSGTIPTTGASGLTCKVGGAWKGPNGAEGFPFGFAHGALKNASSDPTRINFKSGTNYAITAALSHTAEASSGMLVWQGYTSSPGDGGKFVIDGGTGGASYVLLTINGNADATSNLNLHDAILQNNGATGTADGISLGTAQYIRYVLQRVVVNNVRGDGIYSAGYNSATLIECEVYSANQAGTSTDGGFKFSGNLVISRATLVRCIAHDNTGSGFIGNGIEQSIIFHSCVADTNTLDGFNLSTDANQYILLNCDSYNNSRDGLREPAASYSSCIYAENCNFIKNAGYGVNRLGNAASQMLFTNCGFGAGTQANTSGQTSGLVGFGAIGSVTYANDVTPWVDPANGDFRINLAAAKGVGRGAFTQTASSYTGAVAYPDIGAAQHLEAASGAGVPGNLSGGIFQ